MNSAPTDTGSAADAASPVSASSVSASHAVVEPSILYFGTPVVLLSTENQDGSYNLAPMSSAWALGRTVVLGLGREGQTARNLGDRPDLVINLPAPALWPAVERLAPLTGRYPVPATKPAGCRYEPDKFAAAGLRAAPSETVRPPRVAECPLQFEARIRRLRPDVSGECVIAEAVVEKVHADPRIVVAGTDHIDPAAWSPLIYNFRHYFGLGPELGHSYRTRTPRGGAGPAPDPARVAPADVGERPGTTRRTS
ncbi:flavin reductase family protein [Streptomyces smyrnaeus]|uniref:Flavin reductase family protein n=1 Tax=Streptomyces smyrnaeus TaxID=1387713 RepID=A0ABS3XYV2_9ACTN|nr:flavin reductase family protein [Streptomyces smyrnaeus]MBO8200583.1 flavin reductase family protein [Streptomyces smyrnaeus]